MVTNIDALLQLEDSNMVQYNTLVVDKLYARPDKFDSIQCVFVACSKVEHP